MVIYKWQETLGKTYPPIDDSVTTYSLALDDFTPLAAIQPPGHVLDYIKLKHRARLCDILFPVFGSGVTAICSQAFFELLGNPDIPHIPAKLLHRGIMHTNYVYFDIPKVDASTIFAKDTSIFGLTSRVSMTDQPKFSVRRFDNMTMDIRAELMDADPGATTPLLQPDILPDAVVPSFFYTSCSSDYRLFYGSFCSSEFHSAYHRNKFTGIDFLRLELTQAQLEGEAFPLHSKWRI